MQVYAVLNCSYICYSIHHTISNTFHFHHDSPLFKYPSCTHVLSQLPYIMIIFFYALYCTLSLYFLVCIYCMRLSWTTIHLSFPSMPLYLCSPSSIQLSDPHYLGYITPQRVMWSVWCGRVGCSGSWPPWTVGRSWNGDTSARWSEQLSPLSLMSVIQVSAAVVAPE